MKTKNLVERLQSLMKRPAEETPVKKLYKTVAALKKKQKSLEKKLERTDGKRERRRLKQTIRVLRAQRKKGIELYKKLKSE